jgi:hypothetical protein
VLQKVQYMEENCATEGTSTWRKIVLQKVQVHRGKLCYRKYKYIEENLATEGTST